MRKDIKGDTVRVYLEGSLDISNSKALEAELNDIKTKNYKKVIFDMIGLNYVDSSGIGKIFYFFTSYKKTGGDVEIQNVKSPKVREVIELIKMDKIIKIS
ncbi:MAG TPA: STAS domain-containing protein [Petrotogaceae bacterium]|jgi:anti-anti-sigma factor|nr:STAS domain-containing protein [Petrotogaceae bacterium]HPO27655.1 STAS domain-containing protein [Petrotogaceae bacterium]HPX15502.1 STAS domain-containing protein [Petrotogaceae bacterium]HQC40558.1 STAS domain-containing protein [Petrotogaceae bacterium]HQO12023.1 STAS domain-containing protein [Petrotogaceae bacterium]